MVLFTTIKRGLFGVELIFVSLFGINSIVYNHLTIGMLYAFIFYQNISSLHDHFMEESTLYLPQVTPL